MICQDCGILSLIFLYGFVLVSAYRHIIYLVVIPWATVKKFKCWLAKSCEPLCLSWVLATSAQQVNFIFRYGQLSLTMRCHHYHKNIGFQTHKKINKQHHLKNCDSGCSTYKHFLCMSRKDQNFGYCKSISHLNSMHHALPHMCLTPVWWNVDLCVYVNSAGRNVANNFGFSITLWNALFFPCYVR